jgi:phenylacetate-CoA ligase
VTTLCKQAAPLLRYRTRDLSRILPTPCGCESPYPRIARLTGRSDDMVKVRGVAVFPSQIDSILSSIDGVGSEYQLHLWRDGGGHDEALLKLECDAGPALRSVVEAAIRHGLGVRFDVELVDIGSLPRSERKTQRVFDDRA